MAYPIGKLIVPSIYRLWIRKVEGIENIPKDKPFIIAANHTSYFDALLLPVILVPRLNKKMKALVHSYYWRIPLTRFFLDLWGGIPVYISNEKDAKEKNKDSLEKAMAAVKNGDILMIFPEGARSHDGKLKKAYAGIARLALKAKVPVVPAGIINANKILPVGSFFPRFRRCEVKIGKPMHFNKYRPSERSYNEITRNIMKEIARLIHQKYSY